MNTPSSTKHDLSHTVDFTMKQGLLYQTIVFRDLDMLYSTPQPLREGPATYQILFSFFNGHPNYKYSVSFSLNAKEVA